MNKYIQTDKLQKQIDWKNIMEMPRYAGGHDDQMQGLFKGAEVIGHYNEDDYQGQVATCVKLKDGRYAIYNDWYGSCSGCDAWEDANDEDVKNMCIGLANSAYVFKTLDDVKEFLSGFNKDEGWSSWNDTASYLLEEIEKYKNETP